MARLNWEIMGPKPLLHIGTSGWSYKHWAHIFYPDEIKPVKYLEYYTTKFDCVELNTSFYHLPLKSTVQGWIKRTPEHFIFCPKISRYITHQLRLNNAEEALMNFFNVLDEMMSRLGPVLIQLPPGLSFNKLKAESFFHLLEVNYPEHRFAIEIRHKSWLNDDFFDMLKHYKIALVIADSGQRHPYIEIVTTDFVYLRFHGSDKLYSTDYSNRELEYFSFIIDKWLMEGKAVWAFFNNDIGGFAIKNAVKLKALLFR